jgi:hypothetical protein
MQTPQRQSTVPPLLAWRVGFTKRNRLSRVSSEPLHRFDAQEVAKPVVQLEVQGNSLVRAANPHAHHSTRATWTHTHTHIHRHTHSHTHITHTHTTLTRLNDTRPENTSYADEQCTHEHERKERNASTKRACAHLRACLSGDASSDRSQCADASTFNLS